MYVICYSGGHSSALCAIEAVRKHGKENVILLNHDISPLVEDQDIKRFKQEVADYLGLPITYANHDRWETTTPIEVCVEASGWKVGTGQIFCTNRLKTAPFNKWLEENDPDGNNTYIYGFDKTKAELLRAQRRAQIMGNTGYKTEFPLISWERTISSTKEVGIDPPMGYNRFKHANCTGCLKAGWQHWYIVYCERPDIWDQARDAEEEIGYALHKDGKSVPVFLSDKEEMFAKMKEAGVEPTEHMHNVPFWHKAKKQIKEHEESKDLLKEISELEEQDTGVCLDCMA